MNSPSIFNDALVSANASWLQWEHHMRNVFVQSRDAPQTQHSDPDQISNIPKYRCAQIKIFNLASSLG